MIAQSRTLIFSGMAIAMIGLPRVSLLILNVTPSVPVGLYVTSPAELVRGDFVLVARDTAAHRAAVAKGLIRPGMRLLKRVAGLPGNRVCMFGQTVWINGSIKVSSRPADGHGRALRTGRGCRVMAAGQLFVLGSYRNSFDSRYFGPICRDDVVSRVVPIWLF